MTVYVFECVECGKVFEIKYIGGPPTSPPRISHYTPNGRKCHGALRRKYTAPNVHVKEVRSGE